MATPKDTLWEIEPHTVAKHKILETYLKAWFPILNKYNEGLNYIDGFSGPGEYSKGEPGSPIIALEVASKHIKKLRGRIYFLFIEEREDRVKHLKSIIRVQTIPDNFSIAVVKNKFKEVITENLDEFEKEKMIFAPSFIFIDPFGFSGIPFSIVEKLLRMPKIELFINFSVDAINRFIGTKEAGDHIEELFGSKKAVKIFLETVIDNRVKTLRDLYQLRLSEYCKFIRYFEMCDGQNRPIYYLFFCSNNSLGHLKMKESMWKIDSEGDFRFSDKTDPNQTVLFKKDTTEQLMEIFKNEFNGKTVEVEKIEKYVFDKTAFIRKHMIAALKLAEEKEFIEVKEIKTDGNKRRINSFPNDAVVIFK